MKKLSRFIAVFIVLTLLHSSVLNALAAESGWTELPPSEAYTDYLKNPDKYVIPPSYCDDKAIDSQTGTPGVPKASAYDVLPEKYDVRNEITLPPIKDQGDDSTCSSFASTGNYEVFTIKNNDPRSFSEYHEKHSLAQNFSDGPNPFGFDRTPAGTTHTVRTAAYYINGRGPVPADFSPYKYGNDLEPSSFINSVKPEIQTQEAKILPGLGASPTKAQVSQWLNELKALIYKYGSVTMSMTSKTTYSDWTNKYFYFSGKPSSNDHAVVCIGWDDTIPAANFANRNGDIPSVNGGLIFRNSWGSSWGDDGYGYISYGSNDLALQNCVLITDYRERAEEEELNTYSELGFYNVIGRTSTQSQWYGNKFYLEKGERATLKEVSFYAPISDIKYDVYVSPTGDLDRSKFIYLDSVTPDYPGYYSVPTEIDLNSSEYFVVVKSNCGTAKYAVPVEGGGKNVVSGYMMYQENGEQIITAFTSENVKMCNEKGLEWKSLDTSFVASDDYNFSPYELNNVVVNAITEPFSAKVDATVAISETQAVQGDEITVTTDVSSNVSGGAYSYSYNLYHGKTLVETVNTGEIYTFTPLKTGKYYVEVTVTDTVNGVSATVKTDEVNVGEGEFAVNFTVTDNHDGTFSVKSGTIYPAMNVSYCAYVVKDGAVLSKSAYQPGIDLTFEAKDSGSYTVRVYAQNTDGIRVSKTEDINL